MILWDTVASHSGYLEDKNIFGFWNKSFSDKVPFAKDDGPNQFLSSSEQGVKCTQIWFGTGCAAKSQNSYQVLRVALAEKNIDFHEFCPSQDWDIEDTIKNCSWEYAESLFFNFTVPVSRLTFLKCLTIKDNNYDNSLIMIL